jgi:hypothetical protein
MAKVVVFTPDGSGSQTGLTYGDNPMFSSGLEKSRQRQGVFMGADNKPYYMTILAGEGTPDSVDDSMVEKRKDGRNFVSDRIKTGEQGIISGTLVWRYPLMKYWLRNVMGRPKSVTRVDNNFETDNAGAFRKYHFEYPAVGSPEIELWDFWYGVKESATWYGRVKTRAFNQDGSRGGDAGDLTGSLDLHANDFEYDQTFPGFVAESALQNISISGASGGTFKAKVTNPTTGVTAETAALAYNISAAAFQTALQGLANVGAGQLLVTGTEPYAVAAAGTFVNLALATIEIDATSLTGDDPQVRVAVVKAGSDGNGPIELPSKPISIDDKKVYLAKNDAELAAIDFSDDDDARLLGTTASSFSASDLWGPHWTENGSRRASNFIASNGTFTASITVPKGTLIEKWLRDNTNGCVATQFWLVFKEMCGNDAIITYMWVHRSAGATPSNDNDVYQAVYELDIADNPNHSPFQIDVIESWA